MSEDATKPTPADTKPQTDTTGQQMSEASKIQLLLNSAQRDADAVREKYNNAEAERKDLEIRLKEANKKLDTVRKERAIAKPEDLEAWQSEEQKKIRSELAGEIQKRDDELNKLKSQIRELTVVSSVVALARDKFNDDVIEDIKDRARRFCDVNEAGEIIVKDEQGRPRYSKANVSKLMTGEEFLTELAELRPSWAKAQVVPGTKSGSITRAVNGVVAGLPAGFEGWQKPQQREWFSKNPEAARAYIAKSSI